MPAAGAGITVGDAGQQQSAVRVAGDRVRGEPLGPVQAVRPGRGVERREVGDALGPQVDRPRWQAQGGGGERTQLQGLRLPGGHPAGQVGRLADPVAQGAAAHRHLVQQAIGVDRDAPVRQRPHVGEHVAQPGDGDREAGLGGGLTDHRVVRILAMVDRPAGQRPHAGRAGPSRRTHQQKPTVFVGADGVRGDATQRLESGGHGRHSARIEAHGWLDCQIADRARSRVHSTDESCWIRCLACGRADRSSGR
jgi:hypothetical protein